MIDDCISIALIVSCFFCGWKGLRTLDMEGHQIAPKYIWIIIAHYMDIVGVVALESCSKWFQGTVFDESFWKHRLIRDFQNDPSFHYFVDVPARMQYRDLLLFRPDPNEKSPFVQRVVLMGPGADSLLEKLKSMNVASKKQAHHDYYVGEAKSKPYDVQLSFFA